MIDYNVVITALKDEDDECNYRYGGMVPAYYQREIRKSIALLLECLDMQKELSTKKDDVPNDAYMVDQLLKMWKQETSQTEEHHGVRLHHESGNMSDLVIDAGGLGVLISYYITHKSDFTGGGEK